MEKTETKSVFFLRNLSKGLLWLAIIVALFIFSKHHVDKELVEKYEPLFRRVWLVFLTFSLSELVIGIIPPELFLIWALRTDNLPDYLMLAFIFTVISYIAGFTAFLFGRYLHSTLFYQYVRDRFLKKSEKLLHHYGSFLILVAALTPVPFSGIAMLEGAVKYPVKNYIWFSLSRFAKFALSAYVIWEANMV